MDGAASIVTRPGRRAWLVWGVAALSFAYAFLQRVAPSVMVDDLMRDGSSVGAIARVISRLAATGLGARHLDFAACLLQEFYRSKPNSRSKHIDQTGDKQPDHRRCGVLRIVGMYLRHTILE